MNYENVSLTKINKQSKIGSKSYKHIENCASVIKINPINTVGNYHEKRLQDRLKRNNSGNENSYDNIIKSSHDISANKVLRDYFEELGFELNGDISDRQSQVQNKDSRASTRSDINMSDSKLYLPTESSNNSYDSYYRSITSKYDTARYKNNFQNNIQKPFKRNVSLNKPVVINDNRYHYKNADNCPLNNNMYNEEFVSKTMQKLARLRHIVKNLVAQRQKEKQRETWNNYINELKNKHRYYSDESTTISPPYLPTEINQYELIDNYWDATCSHNLSEPCKTILISSCETFGKKDETNTYDKIHLEPKHAFSRSCCYYPISSYGRFTMLNKEMKQSNSTSLTSMSAFNKQRRFMERCYRSKCKTKPTKPLKVKSRGVGTEKCNQDNKKKSTSQLYPMEKIIQTDDSIIERKVTLDEIEQKLDIMLKTFDLAMTEMREQKVTKPKLCPITKSQSTSCSLRSSPDFKIFNKDSSKVLLDTLVRNNDRNIYKVSEVGTNTVEPKECKKSIMDEIIEEEMKKSEQLKQDLKTLLYAKRYNKQRSEEIQFDVPTKEISTVITNSQIRYCPEQEVQVEMLNSLIDKEESNEQIAIAVNTEPLGLLALLQVSSGTIKQLLSYMGNLNYNYLSMLQLPRYSSPEHYECNIFGGMFGEQTKLSDHVQNRRIGNRSDYGGCCHMLSTRSQPGGLFDCKYCGLKFTRAYCCELHQHDCAKRFKKTHEIQTSLMLLR